MERKRRNRLLHDIGYSPGSRTAVFLALATEERAQLYRAMGRGLRRDLLAALADDDLVQVLEALDPDETMDAINLLPNGRKRKVMARFNEQLRKEVEILARFDPHTAAGLMTLDYVLVDDSSTVAEAIKRFRQHEHRTGRAPTVIVLRDGRPAGWVPGHKFAFARPEDATRDHSSRLLTIPHDAEHAEVLQFFRDHPHDKVAVLNDDKQMLGIIYSDDVIRALRENESASLYDFAGVSDEESVTDPARRKVRFRYKWLIANLATAFLAAGTVSLFNDTIAKYVLLAVYMPIVSGMGGNAATQTLAVIVRGISLKQIELKTALPALRRELGASVVNGVITGTLVASVVLIFNRDLRLAVILGIAMAGNLVVAAFFGTLVPLLMKRFGKDPATSATVFITTATDVLGFLMFLGLATLIL